MKTRICKNCNTEILSTVLDNNYSICPNCGNYLRFHAYKRIKKIADECSFVEWDNEIQIYNPLNDEMYAKMIINVQKKHQLSEAIITGEIKINGNAVAIGVMDTRFMMASMGYQVGEKITRLFERAIKKKIPVIIFSCSGGARMQEGIISLMQMEKTSAVVRRHSDAGLLYISVLTNPTMGGVTASFAMLADVILAEKGAMIGFAGPRVIEQNTGEKLPEGFQTAEFQKEHGFIDGIVTRENVREYLSFLLDTHKRNNKYKKQIKIENFEKCTQINKCSPWKRVQIARSSDRPTSMDYINNIFQDFTELYGDRVASDDHAIIAGIARFHGYPVTVIGQQKGKGSLEEAILRNFGMASPAGYRKALRLMKQAEKFRRPIVCFIDTIGAACGKNAEEQGQGIAIANLLQEMSRIQVPVLSIVISEGGSGGALALGIGNEVWMLENAVYSVLTPEGYASILWKDSGRASEAADMMQLEAMDLLKMGVVDEVITEGEPVTKTNIDLVCNDLERRIDRFLLKYQRKSKKFIIGERYRRFRKY